MDLSLNHQTEFIEAQQFFSKNGGKLSVNSFDSYEQLRDVLNLASNPENTADLISSSIIAFNEQITIIDAYNRVLKEKNKPKLPTAEETLRTFFDIVDNDNMHRAFCLTGETGSGKTTAVLKHYPNALPITVTRIMDTDYLTKTPTIVNGELDLNYPSEFSERVKNGGIVLLDEFNNSNSELKQFFQGLFDNKEHIYLCGKVEKIHPDFKCILTMNPDSDVDIKEMIPEALIERIVFLEYSLDRNELAKRLGCSVEWLDETDKIVQQLKDAGCMEVTYLHMRKYRQLLMLGSPLIMIKGHISAGHISNAKIFDNLFNGTAEFQELISAWNERTLEERKKIVKE